MNDGLLFTPQNLGPITLRNRSIRAAAFEGMCPDHDPSQQLYDYHTAVAQGGVGMTTVAYAAVCQSGLSFPHQLWMRPSAVPELKRLTDGIHAAGAKAAIQLGHCGNMAKKRVSGKALSPSGRYNIYGMIRSKAMDAQDIAEVVAAFGDSVRLARDAGFDAVEIHAGHGYLISQFLSPYTNRRKDDYGGPLENRMRFMREVMAAVVEAAADDIAVVVKMNLFDGFEGGQTLEEAVEVAKALQVAGAHALVLSGGFVSRAPMLVMRGSMPIKTLTKYMDETFLKMGVALFGKLMIKSHPFEEKYFLESARVVRREVTVPLIYVGGLLSRQAIEDVLGEGFEFAAMARALLTEPDFVNRLRTGACDRSRCQTSNECIAVMYSKAARCWQEPPS
jgi:2,4-dienoyl-CoA reductase-like NADH-dependent reductase (Old Yellow Enzyme family)